MANVKLGEILRKLRKENNYTQKEVAEMLGLKNKSTLGSWEVGKSEPDGYTFLRLCKIYHVADIYRTFSDDTLDEDIYILSDLEKNIIDKYRSSDSLTKELVHRTLSIDTQEKNGRVNKIS